jgi:hypothetical protein
MIDARFFVYLKKKIDFFDLHKKLYLKRLNVEKVVHLTCDLTCRYVFAPLRRYRINQKKIRSEKSLAPRALFQIQHSEPNFS